MIDQPWNLNDPSQQQPSYQISKNSTYWPVFGSFKNWNIILLSHKATSSEDIDKINKVLLYGISYKVAEMLQTGEAGNIDTTDTTKMGYYMVKSCQKPTHYNNKQLVMEKLVQLMK